MRSHFRTAAGRRPRVPALLSAFTLLLVFGGGHAVAQDKVIERDRPAEPAAAPVVVAPPSLTLEECMALAFERQAALAAARASLEAARDGYQALQNLPGYARLLARDLEVRQRQACHGITIARAGLQQAEWETRYAVTRNFYTVQYARLQIKLLEDLLERLEKGQKTAKRVLESGEVTKVTRIDLDIFAANIDVLRLKQIEAETGLLKAKAALREAIGVGPEYPLDVAVEPLPSPTVIPPKDALIAQALAFRGEVAMAVNAHTVTELEVLAQGRKHFALEAKTFAAGSDIHAKPIPQGVANGEYRPGGIGLEMPVFLIGRKPDRMERAHDFAVRAAAVVDKTQNLVALETEATYLKWYEAKEKLELLTKIQPKVEDIANTIEKRLADGNATGEEYIRATTTLDQIRAQRNEALYLHALALAALERVTAGGYRINPPVVVAPPAAVAAPEVLPKP